MARIVMVGGGMVGLGGAVLLQRDGHDVTVLERDPGACADPQRAWERWERRGVSQFRRPHGFLARFTTTVRAEMPDVATAFTDAGALEWSPLDVLPASITGGPRPGDDRFRAITGRRPLMEAVMARAAADAGVEIRRGVGVRGLVTTPDRDGRIDVQGVVTEQGEELRADLVVDAGGRRSAMPTWLREAGSAGPKEEVDDVGFIYYARHFRSRDGSLPAMRGPVLQPYGSFSTATLPADHGTWSVVIFTASSDRALRRLHDERPWSKVIRACPLVAHWIDAEPITEMDVMAKIEDRRRHYVLDGIPVATGVVPLGDAWAATNPSVGRGLSIGFLHAVGLRDLLRSTPTDDRVELMRSWQRMTDDRVEGYVADTNAFDRHRLAEMQAAAAGRPYTTEDPGWTLGQALRRAGPRDPDLLRKLLDLAQLLRRGRDVLSEPGVVEQVLAHDPGGSLPGPDREELLTLIT